MRKHILFTSIFSLALLAACIAVITASAANITRADNQAAAPIWSDDFEDGQPLTAKYEDVGSAGLSVTTNEAFSGNHALEQHYDQGQVDAGWVCKVNNAGFPDHIFVRWYHKFDESFTSFPPKMARVRYRNRTTWTSTFAVHFWIEENGEAVADVKAPNSSQANPAGWLPIARSGFFFDDPANVGRWIRFEMEVKLNTPGQADGLYRFWADDTLIVERTGVDLRGNTQEKINEVMLDSYWNGGSPIAQSRYYDDFAIATRRIGADQPERLNDLRLPEAIAAGGTLTGTLLWSAPAEAITYTLGHSASPITEANWGSVTTLTLPFSAAQAGRAEQFTVNVPYTTGMIYFALKTQNAAGTWSALSNNASWPHQDIYLPLIRR